MNVANTVETQHIAVYYNIFIWAGLYVKLEVYQEISTIH